MLQQYFGFTRLPFTKDIPPQQLFQADGQSELCARLDYLLKDRGLGLVTGETGCGKSTTLRRFTAALDPNRHFVIYLANPFLGLSGIYRDLLTTLGHETPFGKPKAVARIRSAFYELLHTPVFFTGSIACPSSSSTKPISFPPPSSNPCACSSPPKWTANPWAFCSSLASLSCAAPCA